MLRVLLYVIKNLKKQVCYFFCRNLHVYHTRVDDWVFALLYDDCKIGLPITSYIKILNIKLSCNINNINII